MGWFPLTPQDLGSFNEGLLRNAIVSRVYVLRAWTCARGTELPLEEAVALAVPEVALFFPGELGRRMAEPEVQERMIADVLEMLDDQPRLEVLDGGRDD